MMNKKYFIGTVGSVLLASFVLLNSCKKEPIAPAEPKVYSYTQEFDSMSTAFRQGWVARNNSRPLGTTVWTTGNYYWDSKNGGVGGFPGYNNSYSGSDYALTDYACQGDPVSGTGVASNWLISPSTYFRNGDVISFYTRVELSPATYADRMEFRINLNNNSVNVGTDDASVGDFTTLAETINSDLSADGYPAEWTKVSYTISGLTKPVWGRFAFRYYTPDAGNAGTNGSGIGIDAVNFSSNNQ